MIRYSILFPLAAIFSHEMALASDSVCEKKNTYELSLDQMLQDSQGVFLVRVTNVKKDNESRFKGRPSYTYDLSIFDTLRRGDAVIGSFEYVGLRPLYQIPQAYFATTERHKLIDPEGPWMLGTGILVENVYGGCSFTTSLRPGFQYLVFKDLDNKISIEPIHSQLVDNWFRLVETRSKSH